jgi:hypothetical protein
MKNFIPAVAVLLSTTILANSCAVSNNSVAPQNSAVQNVNEASATCFVQLNDGSIKQFSTLKLVTGVFATPHLLGDGKAVINSKDIIAYQNDKHYAVSSKILTSTKSATVSVETLPGFAVKVVSGKLNVYCRKFYNGANSTNEYFLQDGSDGYIVSYTKDVLISMLKDDMNATAFFKSKTKVSPTSKKMLTAVEIYNKGQMMTKN